MNNELIILLIAGVFYFLFLGVSDWYSRTVKTMMVIELGIVLLAVWIFEVVTRNIIIEFPVIPLIVTGILFGLMLINAIGVGDFLALIPPLLLLPVNLMLLSFGFTCLIIALVTCIILLRNLCNIREIREIYKSKIPFAYFISGMPILFKDLTTKPGVIVERFWRDDAGGIQREFITTKTPFDPNKSHHLNCNVSNFIGTLDLVLGNDAGYPLDLLRDAGRIWVVLFLPLLSYLFIGYLIALPLYWVSIGG